MLSSVITNAPALSGRLPDCNQRGIPMTAYRLAAIAAAILLLAACGGGGASTTGSPSKPGSAPTFASVPGNIIDAPVARDEWRSVKRRSRVQRVYIFTWTAGFSQGGVLVEKVAPGGLFTGKGFYGEHGARQLAARRGYTRLSNVQAVGNQTGRWGHIAEARWRNKQCVVGAVVTATSRFPYSHQGAGDIIGGFRDCRPNAANRFGSWKTWLHGFKSVDQFYNMPLDK